MTEILDALRQSLRRAVYLAHRRGWEDAERYYGMRDRPVADLHAQRNTAAAYVDEQLPPVEAPNG